MPIHRHGNSASVLGKTVKEQDLNANMKVPELRGIAASQRNQVMGSIRRNIILCIMCVIIIIIFFPCNAIAIALLLMVL